MVSHDVLLVSRTNIFFFFLLLQGFDCGVFTCLFADYVSLNRELEFGQEEATCYRRQLVLAIIGETTIA